jgi:hypothetical protein
MAKWTDDSVRAALGERFKPRTYPFPGKPEIMVGIKLLTDSELDKVRLQAAVFAKSQQADLNIDPEFFERAIQRELISRAYVDPDKPDEPFFPSQRDVAELDNLSVRSLYELYVTHQQSLDPYAYCPPEDIERLADSLGKSESSVGLLNLYDAPTLRSLLLSLALRQRETRASPN